MFPFLKKDSPYQTTDPRRRKWYPQYLMDIIWDHRVDRQFIAPRPAEGSAVEALVTWGTVIGILVKVMLAIWAMSWVAHTDTFSRVATVIFEVSSHALLGGLGLLAILCVPAGYADWRNWVAFRQRKASIDAQDDSK